MPAPTAHTLMSPGSRSAVTARPTLSTRRVAIERAAEMRALHHRLSSEFEPSVPPGHVLAVAVRCARSLQRAGCTPELLPGATERLVRATLLTRST